MKPLVTVLLSLFLVPWASAGTHDVRHGTFAAPDEFVFVQTGTRDSFQGTLTRKSDGFTISFDVGRMAGIHMSDRKKDGCTFFREHHVPGGRGWTGISQAANGKRITSTIIFEAPANFWADFKDESDLAEFMLIVASYRPKEKADAGK